MLLWKAKISAYLLHTYFPHFAKSHYFILHFQDNVTRSRSFILGFTILWDSIDFLLFRIFIFSFPSFFPDGNATKQ